MNPYVALNRIEFAITNACSSACRHCSLGEQLKGKAISIDKQVAVKLIESVCGEYPITSVMTFGGEPLLYADTTMAIHDAAKKWGVPHREVITNGFFTKSLEKIDEVAQQISQSCIEAMLVSVDVFHEEFVPIDLQKYFVDQLKRNGFDNLYLHPVWVKHKEADNPYNHKTKACLDQFADLGVNVSDGNRLFPSGYALEHFKAYFDAPQVDLNLPCGSYDYTESPGLLKTLFVCANGDIEVCGKVIGNVMYEDILEVLSSYDPYEDQALACVLEHGVEELVNRARLKGITYDESKCYSTCSVCRAIRNQ